MQRASHCNHMGKLSVLQLQPQGNALVTVGLLPSAESWPLPAPYVAEKSRGIILASLGLAAKVCASSSSLGCKADGCGRKQQMTLAQPQPEVKIPSRPCSPKPHLT